MPTRFMAIKPTLNDDEALINYAKPIVNELRAHEVRIVGDYGSDPMKAKIAEAEKMRVHTMLVIGGRDPARRDRHGERPSPRQRPTMREADRRSNCGSFDGDSAWPDPKCNAGFQRLIDANWRRHLE